MWRLDLATLTFPWHTANAGRGELKACYLTADKFVVICSLDGRVWSTPRANPGTWTSEGYIANREAMPDWNLLGQCLYQGGLVYIPIANRRCICGCDPSNGFKVVEKIHLPPGVWTSPWSVTAVSCPDGDLYRWFVLRFNYTECYLGA